MAKVKVETTRFGEVEVEEEVLLRFPNGIIGFEGLDSFVMLEGPEGTPLKWLQSTNEPAIAFVIADPSTIVPGYVVRVNGEDLDPLELDTPEDAAVAVIITVPGELEKATCNLLAPVVFNVEKRLGIQVVLDGDYPIRHPLASREVPVAEERQEAGDGGEKE